MVVSKVIKQGGEGTVLLFGYIVSSLLFWFPEKAKFQILMPAAIASFLVAYLLALFSDEVIGFLHWPTLVKVANEINEHTGNDDFYFDHRKNWDKLDEYDDKVYRDTVALISGVTVSLTLPIQGFYSTEISIFFVCVVGSLISGIVFIYKPYVNSKETIMTASKLYE